MIKSNLSLCLFARTVGLGLMAAASAYADNTHYAPGDLVLGFQKKGNTNTVYVNLGNAATIYRGAAAGPDAANKVNFLDIGPTLISAFGAGWASDPDIYAGLAGVFGTSPTNTLVTDGDPQRTLYISRNRGTVGTVGLGDSPQWDLTLAGNTAMSSAATGIQQQNNAFDGNYDAQMVVSPASVSQIDNQNPLVTGGNPPVTSQGPAMGGALEGGIQQSGNAASFGNFGYAASVEYALDLYRVVARGTGGTGPQAPLAGQVAGNLRVGSYEGTVTVGTNGKVSFLTTPTGINNSHYAPGDLVLGFQKKGNTNTVYVDLGNAATIYRGTAAGPDGANKVNFLDIGPTLTSAFGAGWASDPDIYAGLAGVLGTSTTSTLVTNGDPQRTLYISRARGTLGTVGLEDSPPWDLLLAGNTAMSSAATGIQQQNNAFDNNYDDQMVVSLSSVSQIDNQNPLVTGGSPPVTSQGSAMGGALEGGIQQAGMAGTFGTFGYAGSVEFALDLYRVLARGTGGTGQQAPIAGQVAGNLRAGSYEGTVTVGTNGMVSFLTAPTGFDTWVLGYPSLTEEADRLPGADPDGDGMSNLLEFAINGNPTVSSQFIVPTLNATGSDFVFTFKRRDISETNSTLIFRYSTDLTAWTEVTLGPGDGTAEPASYTVQENGTNADLIQVKVPKSVAPGGKLFGGLAVVRP